MVNVDLEVTGTSRESRGGPGGGTGWLRWLDRPLSRSWCAFGWLTATAIFIGIARLLGGPTDSDSPESLYSTWAIAHGHLSCAYPAANRYHIPSVAHPGPFIAPLWPLLSGGIAALARIGHTVPFPSTTMLGPNCTTAYQAMFHWSVQSGAAAPTVRLGYLSVLVLMAGAVVLLRATGRGLRVWEPVALVLVACTPAAWMALLEYFHPQDIVAMGLVLGGLACVRRDRWLGAGILLGFAVTSQQFALLVLAPLVVVVPAHRRVRFVGAAIVADALLVVPVLVATSGRAFSAAVIGSGNTASYGGTVLWELHLHGALLVASSRLAPIALSMTLACWAQRRLGPELLNPVPLVSLIATSLALRLVFEQNLFGYYFTALALLLVLLDVVRGRLREEVVAWLALLTLAFSPVPWGFVSNSMAWGLQEREFLPFVGMAVALVVVIHDVRRHRVRWYRVGWLAVVVVAFVRLPWTDPPFRPPMPTWFWQIVLVASGVALAVGPLMTAMRDRTASGFNAGHEQISLISC
jgi:hypothetical protein